MLSEAGHNVDFQANLIFIDIFFWFLIGSTNPPNQESVLHKHIHTNTNAHFRAVPQTADDIIEDRWRVELPPVYVRYGLLSRVYRIDWLMNRQTHRGSCSCSGWDFEVGVLDTPIYRGLMKRPACYQRVWHCIDILATGHFFLLFEEEKGEHKNWTGYEMKQNHHQSKQKTKPVSTVLLVSVKRVCKCVWTRNWQWVGQLYKCFWVPDIHFWGIKLFLTLMFLFLYI